jgi:hypothetical protein
VVVVGQPEVIEIAVAATMVAGRGDVFVDPLSPDIGWHCVVNLGHSERELEIQAEPSVVLVAR